MKIHVIGNSHVCMFSGPGFSFLHYGEKIQRCTQGDIEYVAYHIGPVIAYNFYEHHLPEVRDILTKYVNKETDYVMLVVGEVDCRWHLPFQAAAQNRDLDELTKECVNRFFRSYEDLHNEGYKCITWGSHPSTNKGHDANPNVMIYGDNPPRNQASKVFAAELCELSHKLNISHVSILDELLNPDGSTKMDSYLDYCHLKPELLPHITELIRKAL